MSALVLVIAAASVGTAIGLAAGFVVGALSAMEGGQS